MDRVAEGVVLLRRVGVQGDGHHVEPSGEIRADIPAVNQIPGAVGVHADEGLFALGLELVDDPADIFNAVAGLAEAAEDQLLVFCEVPAFDVRQDFLLCGLPLQPQIVGVDAAAAAVVPEAEFTVEVAAVGDVDIQVFPILIGDGKSFFHRWHSFIGHSCKGENLAG